MFLLSFIRLKFRIFSSTGRIQQVAEGAQAPPALEKLFVCVSHWEIEVKIEVILRLGTSRLKQAE